MPPATRVILLVFLFGAHAVSAVPWTPRSVVHAQQPWKTASGPLNGGVVPPFSSRMQLSLLDDDDTINSNKSFVASVARGGRQAVSSFEKTVETIVQILVSIGRTVLPPLFEFGRVMIAFYRSLPTDSIIAQAGLVYCFAGGYYPTLFAALSAAQNCGWETAVQAVSDLAQQASLAADAVANHVSTKESKSYHEVITQKTMVVLKTIDPVKINMATGALYTTWLGVSTVLEREFAKTITLSLTIAGYLRPITQTVLAPPIYLCVPNDYHKWVPVLLGWACKAAAMSLAWRVQRVLTATTSAITGGLMFSRAIMRMASKKTGVHIPGLVTANHEDSPLDEVLGLCVAGVGLYSQIGHGFSFRVPFPLSLVTWPFDIAENWIQWQITKEVE